MCTTDFRTGNTKGFISRQYERMNARWTFGKQDVHRLGAARAAQSLPDVFKCQDGVLVGSTEALCICLRRFAYPCCYADLVPRFGRPVSQLCMVTNIVINLIYDEFATLLQNLDQAWLSPPESSDLCRFCSCQGSCTQ